jgi:hypothetical protein
LNQDGNVDYRASSNNGLLDEVEILYPDKEIPGKKQKYIMSKLSSAEYDANGDGIFDVNYEYHDCQEVKKKSNN